MKIDVLSSVGQTLGAHGIVLGLDAEVLLRRPFRQLWPHQVKCPQKRIDNGDWSFSMRADWHGDGYAFELCTQPASCLDALLYRIGTGFSGIRHKLKNPTFTAPVLYTVPERVAAKAPAEVRRLGCSPSFNVYDDPGDPTILKPTERTTGFHLHMSHPRMAAKGMTDRVVRWADVVVGNAWNYIATTDKHAEARRRAAYGRAGEHRSNIYPNKVHGVEYRVLPGAVITNPAYVTLMFSLYRYALHMATGGAPSAHITDTSIKALNTADADMSHSVLLRLPFTPESLSLLGFFRKHPPRKFASLAGWSAAATMRQGHRWYYAKGNY